MQNSIIPNKIREEKRQKKGTLRFPSFGQSKRQIVLVKQNLGVKQKYRNVIFHN